MLVGQLNDDIKQIFLSIANESDFEIEVMESDINHIHFLIRYIPRWSIAHFIFCFLRETMTLTYLQSVNFILL